MEQHDFENLVESIPQAGRIRRGEGEPSRVFEMNRDLTHFQILLRQQLPFLAQRFHVASLGLFGSFVRNQNRPDSDLDVLVDFTEAPSLFRLIELENYLSDLLGIKVDLVMREGLKPHIGSRILAELVPI